MVDAMIGQDAVNLAKNFNDKLNIDGVVLTKFDGDTRGGAALSIKSVVGKPIKFVGVGEKNRRFGTVPSGKGWLPEFWEWGMWYLLLKKLRKI